MSTSAYLGTGSRERSSAWTARLTSSKYGATGRTAPGRRTENGQPLSPASFRRFAPLFWNLFFIACADGLCRMKGHMTEAKTLQELEAVIERGLETYVEVGNALRE